MLPRCCGYCDRTCTPRAPTTPWKPCPKWRSRGNWACASRSSAMPKSTLPANCCPGCAACLMPEAAPARFLIVRLGSLGDLVHTLPAVAALRASFPSAAIDWAVEEKWVPLISLVEGINRIIPLRRTRAGYFACVGRLRAGRYTCAVDFQGLYKSALLAWLSGAARRVGFDRQSAREPGAAWFYTERVAPVGRHVAELNLSLAMRAGAARPPAMQFPLRVPVGELQSMAERLAREGIAGDYLVVSPGGGWTSKCWPAQRYGELCGELWRRHRIPVVVNEGPGEAGLAAGVIQGSA